MNKKILGGIIALLIIAAGALVFTRNNTTTEVASNSSTAESATQASVETASIKSLIESGRNRMCTFKTVESGTESEGTVYVADGKMRGDFAIQAGTTSMISHMIHDGSTGFVWTDGQATGFKIAIDTNEISAQQDKYLDPNKNLEFNCEAWSQDSFKFKLPSDIAFNEIPKAPTADGTVNSKEVQQAVCNSLPEPAKSQCISAIK
jgi:hypothetical protein